MTQHPELSRRMKDLANQAAANAASGVDLNRIVAHVEANRRRREVRQRAGVGVLALALVGGLTYGGLQILGNPGATPPAAPGPATTSGIGAVGFLDAQCGLPFDPGTLEQREIRLITPNTPVSVVELEPLIPDYTTYSLSPDTNTGTRTAETLTQTWLLNPDGGEHFTASSHGQVHSVAVRDGKIVGLINYANYPLVNHDLAPGQAELLTTYDAFDCNGTPMALRKGDQVYHYLKVSQDGEDRVVWGGPWTFDPDYKYIDRSNLQGQQCLVYGVPSDGNQEHVDCPLEIILAAEVTDGPTSTEDLHWRPITLALSPDVSELSGKVRALALVEFTDADGKILNPEVGIPADTPFTEFNLVQGRRLQLDIYSGDVPAVARSAITLPPGTIYMRVTVDLEITGGTLADGTPYPLNGKPNMRIDDAPVEITIVEDN